MLQTATRPTDWLDWHSSGVHHASEAARRSPMANPQRNLRGGSSAAAAQPLGFRNHLGQIPDANDSLAGTSVSLGSQQSTYAPFAQATVASQTHNHHWPPQATTLQTAHIDHSAAHYAAEQWQQYHTGAPRRSVRGLQTPSIQISTTFDSLDNLATPTATYPQDYLAVDRYSMLYDHQISQMAAEVAPVSPVSHHSAHSRHVTPLPEAGRKRSFSEVSQDARSPVAASLGDYATPEQPAVRKSRTIRRPDAPMNADHKYICNISSECAGLVFDRKCEWGKHMDKHDRPYRCPNPACAKLQGFTYSGGLLRHEREVHNKHGGPKAFLMCPYPTCKRHSEKGFTRKENLQEHIRRVHSDADPEIAHDLESLEPTSALSTGASADDLYAAATVPESQHKLSNTGSQIAGEVEELRDLVRKLRTENEAKSAVIQRLEDDARAQSARLAILEHAMQQQAMR